MRHDRIDPSQNSASSPPSSARTEDWQPEYIGKPHTVDTGDADAVVRERSERTAPLAAGDPWIAIKSRFVDDPSGAVADAEQLVREMVDERIRELQEEAAAVYAHDHEAAYGAANGEVSGDASTEALRSRLIRYQAYCQRLAGRALH